jgi:hypothetical protein
VILEQEIGLGYRSAEGEPDSRCAAVKEKLFFLSSGSGVDNKSGGTRFTRCVVMIAGRVGRKIVGASGIDSDRTPSDGVFGVLFAEGKVAARIERWDRGVGIPLRDKPFRKGSMNGNGGLARGIEIEDGSLQAQGAAEPALEIDLAEVFDEGRKVGGSRKRESGHSLTIGSGDGGKGAPFMSGEFIFRRLPGCGALQGRKVQGRGAPPQEVQTSDCARRSVQKRSQVYVSSLLWHFRPRRV